MIPCLSILTCWFTPIRYILRCTFELSWHSKICPHRQSHSRSAVRSCGSIWPLCRAPRRFRRLWPLPHWLRTLSGSRRRFLSTTRHRAKGTAGTGRIGHGSATYQTANLCGKLNRASPPRPQSRAGAPNLRDDSGKYEDLGTTERPFGCPEITERRIRRRETRPRRMRSTSVS